MISHNRKELLKRMYKYVYIGVCSVMSNSAIPWTAACQAPLFMEFSRQEYWLPSPSPGDLPNPGIKPASLALAGRFFAIEPPGKPMSVCVCACVCVCVCINHFVVQQKLIQHVNQLYFNLKKKKKRPIKKANHPNLSG